jgi:5'(3')-deoxyribonucleotidase
MFNKIYAPFSGTIDKVLVDMDGVIVDFDAYKAMKGLTPDEVKRLPGAYREMPPMPGAIEAVRRLIALGCEVWIATKPPTGQAHAYADKVLWIMDHLPELQTRIIITHDKGLLGCHHDYLCDDRPHKANCEQFPGTLLAFVEGFHWAQALPLFEQWAEGFSQSLAGKSETL